MCTGFIVVLFKVYNAVAVEAVLRLILERAELVKILDDAVVNPMLKKSALSQLRR